MKRWTMVLVALATILMVEPGAAQSTGENRARRARIEERFDIVPLSNGIALTPKARIRDVRLIEISEGVITVNGTPVSGRELRERVGGDADAILWLSYLPADQRREMFGGPGASAAPRRNARPELDPVEQEMSARARRSSGQRVRIFGDVVIDENESIGGEAVAVIGSVRVNGEVGSEVVAVLGSIDLGPKAVVHGDVVSVGGRVRRAAGAQIRGGVTEVSLGDVGLHLDRGPWGPYDWRIGGFDALPRLLGSTFRVLLLILFAGIAFVVARGAVENSAHRVGDNAPKALLVGLAAELLFGPVFLLTAVVLVLTIIGIPLLLLLPFGVVVLLLMALAGFTGTACAIGHAARARFGLGGGQSAFFDIVIGVLVILSPLLLGRFIAMGGWVTDPVVWLLVAAGTAFEFVAWTTGFGAVLINTFSGWRARRAARAVPTASA